MLAFKETNYINEDMSTNESEENRRKEKNSRSFSNSKMSPLSTTLEELKNGTVFLKKDLIAKKYEFELLQKFI